MQRVVQLARRGTLRGLHFQADPHAEDKLVRCTAGAIFDVIVDLRAGIPHRAAAGSDVELTPRTIGSLFVPKGFAHGFMTLRDDTRGAVHDLGALCARL